MKKLIDASIGTTDNMISVHTTVSGEAGYGARLMVHRTRMSDFSEQSLKDFGVFKCRGCERWRDGSQEFFDAGVCVHCCRVFREVV